jgi:hypothetical protein
MLKQSQETGQIDMDGLSKMHNEFQMRASGNPYASQRLTPALDHLRKRGVSEHAKRFDGDLSTPEGSLAYADYMSEAAGMFGGKVDPDKAMQRAKMAEELKNENLEEGLRALHRGDIGAAEAAINASGNIRGKLLTVEPAEYNLGGRKVETRVAKFQDSEGNVTTVNAADGLFRLMSFDKQIAAEQANQRIGLERERVKEGKRSNIVKEGLDALKHQEDVRSNRRNEEISEKKASAEGDSGAGTRSDSKQAVDILNDNLGITKDPLKQTMNHGRADMDMYGDVTQLVDDLVRDGARPGEAANVGYKMMMRAIALHDGGEGLSKTEAAKAAKKYALGEEEPEKDKEKPEAKGAGDNPWAGLW